jgi:hypothetical protein
MVVAQLAMRVHRSYQMAVVEHIMENPISLRKQAASTPERPNVCHTDARRNQRSGTSIKDGRLYIARALLNRPLLKIHSIAQEAVATTQLKCTLIFRRWKAHTERVTNTPVPLPTTPFTSQNPKPRTTLQTCLIVVDKMHGQYKQALPPTSALQRHTPNPCDEVLTLISQNPATNLHATWISQNP